MRFIIASVLAVICASALAAITIPLESEPHKLIRASVDIDISETDDFVGGWKVDGETDLQDLGDGKAVLCATPGEHTIRYSGFVIHLKEVEVMGMDGKPMTILTYIGSDEIEKTAVFTVKDEAPPDEDEDGDEETVSPIAADGLRVLIVRETNQQLSREQATMLTSTIWRKIVGEGNYRILDPDTEFLAPSIWKDALLSTKGMGVPRLIVSNRPHGGFVGELVDTDAMVEIVTEWGNK